MNFKQLPNGMCDGFVLIKRCEVKKTKAGAEYLDLVIADKTDEMNAKMWDYHGGAELLQADTVAKIRGTVESYNGKDQFRVSQIRPASDSDDYNLSDLVPSSEVGGEQLFDMIMKRVTAFENEELKSIVTTIMTENKDKLITCPAALKLHHAMVGGLMYHTMSILRMAEEICKIYVGINKELLLSGVILHDVAKIWEYNLGTTGLAKSYTAEGELIGHLVKGAMYIGQVADRLGINSDTVMLLQHMLISHHGVPEYGIAVRPMFLEAIILSSLDTLDATIYEVNSGLSGVEAGGFSDRQWALDNRKLYNHGLSDNTHSVNFDSEV